MINLLSCRDNGMAENILTENQSMFLEKDGFMGFLYPCPIKIFPTRVLDTRYDLTMISYDGITMLVNSMAQQTYFASEIYSTVALQILHHFELDKNQ